MKTWILREVSHSPKITQQSGHTPGLRKDGFLCLISRLVCLVELSPEPHCTTVPPRVDCPAHGLWLWRLLNLIVSLRVLFLGLQAGM